MDSDWGIASKKLQTNPDTIQKWLKRWRVKANKSKSVYVTFTTRREACQPVHINNVHLPQQDVKYLALHLNNRLTWRKHILTERKHLAVTLTKMHWLFGRKSKLSTSNKILIYKAILKPVWSYGIQLWGTASTAPNTVVQRDLRTPTVKEEIHHYSSQYSARLRVHPNNLVVNLMAQPKNRWLWRRQIICLPDSKLNCLTCSFSL
jgi:hypothetical protein